MLIEKHIGESPEYSLIRPEKIHFGTLKLISPRSLINVYKVKATALTAGNVCNIGPYSWALRRIVVCDQQPYWLLERPNFHIRTKLIGLIENYITGLKQSNSNLGFDPLKLASKHALGQELNMNNLYTVSTYQIYCIYEVLHLYVNYPQLLLNRTYVRKVKTV